MKRLKEDKALPAEDERLIHADSGEGGQLDLSPDKEKIDKEVMKELEDRVEYVEDEINDAETPKPEATTDSGKGVEGLTKPAKIKEKLILEEPSDMLSERLILPEEDESLDEAIPKDAIQAYKRAPGYDPRTSNVDYNRSNLTELTPEEAQSILKKEGSDNLRLLIGDHLVKISGGHGDTDYRRSYVGGDKAYVKRSGDTVNDTRYMPAKHLLSIADKIYLADEKQKDADTTRARRNNPESRLTTRADVLQRSAPAANIVDTSYRTIGSQVRGTGGSRWSDTMGPKDLQRSIVVGNGTRDRDYKNAGKDAAARLRYIDSEVDLQGRTNEYANLKRGLRRQQNELERASTDLDNAKSSGSPETTYKRKEVERLETQLRQIRRQLALLNFELEGADEADAEAISVAQERFDNAKSALDQAQSRISQLLGRNR